MHYQTVKDVVDHSRKLHRKICQLYHQLSEDQSQQKVSMLLNYLQCHESYLEESLCKFEGDKSQKVLESWFQYAPDHDLNDVLSDMELHDHMSTDQVLSMALKLDDYFIDLYEDMVRSSSSSSVRAVFQNLLDMEQQEKIRTAKTAMQMYDM